MNRKTLILCIVTLAAMFVAVGVAVIVLYSGTESTSMSKSMDLGSRYALLPAVPSDAVAVCCLSEAADMADSPLGGFSFPAALLESFAAGKFASMASEPIAVSLHYSGKLIPLYVFETGRTGQPSDEVSEFMSFAKQHGLHAESLTDGVGVDRSIVLASPLEGLVSSSVRHMEQGLSVMDAKGFADAAEMSMSDCVMFFANSSARVLLRGALKSVTSSMADFFSSLSEWTIVDLSQADRNSLSAQVLTSYSSDVSDFMNVFDAIEPSSCKASSFLPSYVLTAVSVPMEDPMAYIEAYKAYLDSKQNLASYNRTSRLLSDETGVQVESFVKRLGIKEAVNASFRCGSGIEKVNLVRIARTDTLIAHKTGADELENCAGKVMSYSYGGYLAAAFGAQWKLKDESFFTYHDGWIISGSEVGVKEYVSGRALEYTLESWLADAGIEDMMSVSGAVASCYVSLNQPQGALRNDFTKAVIDTYRQSDASPLFLTLRHDRKKTVADLNVTSTQMKKVRAPKYQRDTLVVVPKGPFTVKNSATGKNNQFYQNSHLSICLRDEKGKDMWGVVFKEKLCGTAHNIDYYGNGKLQIIFGAGSKVYVIDRLGKFVQGFPIDLGKEILLGPDVYDFSGANAYNIMVLHKDNTIEMYNLKARKPSSWQGITLDEKIKALPERILVGGRNFWVVRTSLQALIYPFNGGTPITEFEGDKMIKPDSEVKVVDASTVEVSCYDGQDRTVRLK